MGHENIEWTTEKNVSFAEAANLIAKDETDILNDHGGFFEPGELPFSPPIHKPRGIVIWPPADIHPGATIGEGVMIGRYTNICGAIKIGAHTRIQGFCFIPDAVEIGEYCFIGPGVIFCNMKRPRVRNSMMKDRDGKVVIEDDARIGAGVILCPGVRVGSGAMVGAGAVVTKDVPADSTIVGVPAKKLMV